MSKSERPVMDINYGPLRAVEDYGIAGEYADDGFSDFPFDHEGNPRRLDELFPLGGVKP